MFTVDTTMYLRTMSQIIMGSMLLLAATVDRSDCCCHCLQRLCVACSYCDLRERRLVPGVSTALAQRVSLQLSCSALHLLEGQVTPRER